MKDNHAQNNPDDLFRRGMENLPEEKASQPEWGQLLFQLKREGVIAKKKNRKKFFLWLSFAAASILCAALAFILRTDDASQTMLKRDLTSKEKPIEQIKNNFSNGNKPVTTEEADGKNSGYGKNIPSPSHPDVQEKEDKPSLISHTHSSDFSPTGNNILVGPVTKESHTANNAVPVSSAKLSEGSSNTLSSSEHPVNLSVEKSVTSVSSSASSEISMRAKKPSEQVAITPKDSAAAVSSKKDSVKTQMQTPVAIKKDSSNVIAQQPNNKKENKIGKKAKHIWVGGYFSWDATHYKAKNMNTAYGESQYVLNAFNPNNDSVKQLQFTVGITGGYNFHEHFSFEGGIFYSQKKKASSSITLPMYISQYGESISEYSYYYNAQYLEINGRLKYSFGKGKVSYYVAPGIFGSFNFPVKEEKRGYFTRTFFSESTSAQSEKIILEPSSLGMSASMAVGVEIHLTSKWSIYAEPSYRYAFNPVIKHPTYDQIPVNHFWRTVSFGLGCMYHF
ncbi:MAG: outer membrane beta-barrel protein [Bacteroidia bacterium]